MSDFRDFESSARPQRAEQRGANSTTLGNAASSAQDQAQRLYDTASEQVTDSWTAAQAYARSRPFLTVASAAVVGAGLGWLLPSGKRETEIMADVAHKVTDVARDAADSAVEVGRQQVNELTQDTLASVGGAVVEAVIGGGNTERR